MTKKPMRKLVENNTKDCLWVYVLRILSDGPTHAYALRKDIEARFGFRPGTVTAYRVLYALVSQGMVSKKAEGRRKVYEVTTEGRKELLEAVGFYRKMAKDISI